MTLKRKYCWCIFLKIPTLALSKSGIEHALLGIISALNRAPHFSCKVRQTKPILRISILTLRNHEALLKLLKPLSLFLK